MKYQDFLNYIKEHLIAIFDSDTIVSIESIKKNNGIVQEGLIIRKPDLNISPTIYLNPYYHQYLDGIPLTRILQDILFLYHQNVPAKNFDTASFTDFSKVKHQIIFKLVNYEKNRTLLKEVPHIRYLDFAILFQYLLTDIYQKHATILIHNHHLEYWQTSLEELSILARQNTPRLLPQEFKSLTSILGEAFSRENDTPHQPFPMYVLTNTHRISGATTILYEGLLKNISQHFNKNLILLPSSIHEFLIVPVDSPDHLEFYSQMVRDVNSADVSDDEILSNHAYYFSKEDGKIIQT